jgi:hypothetical protein
MLEMLMMMPGMILATILEELAATAADSRPAWRARGRRSPAR